MVSLVVFNTSQGWMGIIGSSLGLKEIILPQKSKQKLLSHFGDNHYHLLENDFSAFSNLPQRLRRYLGGELINFTDTLDLAGTTAFQQSVWRITQNIPYGKTRSYSWISDQLGYAGKAARAVGQALGKNPLPIVIPCHRVISADGSLGGFTGGLELKNLLLNLESAQ